MFFDDEFDNPKWVIHKARNGILKIRFSPDGATPYQANQCLEDFVKFGLKISQPNRIEENRKYFRLLDTSMSDSAGIVESILEKCYELKTQYDDDQELQRLIKIHILLADPKGNFAAQRAESIKNADNSPLERTLDGLKQVEKSLIDISAKMEDQGCKVINKYNFTGDKNKEIIRNIAELTEYLNEQGRDFGLKIKFYSEVPSGPMYFLQNILIQGRFCSGYSATQLPWMAIVNDPACPQDLYDIFSNEFDNIWNNSDLSYDFSNSDTEEVTIGPDQTREQLLETIKTLSNENEKLKQENKNSQSNSPIFYIQTNSTSAANAMQESSNFEIGSNNNLQNVAGRDFKDNIIGNLEATSDPQQPGIKEGLEQLINAVDTESSLKEFQKTQIRNQIAEISAAYQDPDQESKKDRFQMAKNVLKALLSAIGPTAGLIKIWDTVQPILDSTFSSKD